MVSLSLPSWRQRSCTMFNSYCVICKYICELYTKKEILKNLKVQKTATKLIYLQNIYHTRKDCSTLSFLSSLIPSVQLKEINSKNKIILLL